jgi:hypothetical protein
LTDSRKAYGFVLAAGLGSWRREPSEVSRFRVGFFRVGVRRSLCDRHPLVEESAPLIEIYMEFAQ